MKCGTKCSNSKWKYFVTTILLLLLITVPTFAQKSTEPLHQGTFRASQENVTISSGAIFALSRYLNKTNTYGIKITNDENEDFNLQEIEGLLSNLQKYISDFPYEKSQVFNTQIIGSTSTDYMLVLSDKLLGEGSKKRALIFQQTDPNVSELKLVGYLETLINDPINVQPPKFAHIGNKSWAIFYTISKLGTGLLQEDAIWYEIGSNSSEPSLYYPHQGGSVYTNGQSTSFAIRPEKLYVQDNNFVIEMVFEGNKIFSKEMYNLGLDNTFLKRGTIKYILKNGGDKFIFDEENSKVSKTNVYCTYLPIDPSQKTSCDEQTINDDLLKTNAKKLSKIAKQGTQAQKIWLDNITRKLTSVGK